VRAALPALLVRFFGWPPATRAAMALATWIDRPLLRWSRGRLRLSFPIPVLLLEARGARSGLRREVPLLYVPDDGDCLVIGSHGGRPRDPAWCSNLRAAARVTALRAGRRQAYRVRELVDGEYASAWSKAVALYPGYDAYARRAGRHIPIFRLVPEQRPAQ
jgi:deazaflavin-dependent oxidoreductase (nitroreductase family)